MKMTNVESIKAKLKAGPVKPKTLTLKVSKARQAMTEEHLRESYGVGMSTTKFAFPSIIVIDPGHVTVMDHGRGRTVKHDGEVFRLSLGSSGHSERYRLDWYVNGEAIVKTSWTYTSKIIADNH